MADLGNDSFDVREKATGRLEEMGAAAAPALQKAMQATQSGDVKKRLQAVIDRVSEPADSPTALRRLRAIRILGRFDSADAHAALRAVIDAPMQAQEATLARFLFSRQMARPPTR